MTLSPEQEEKLLRILEFIDIDKFGNVHINTNIIVKGDVIIDD